MDFLNSFLSKMKLGSAHNRGKKLTVVKQPLALTLLEQNALVCRKSLDLQPGTTGKLSMA